MSNNGQPQSQLRSSNDFRALPNFITVLFEDLFPSPSPLTYHPAQKGLQVLKINVRGWWRSATPLNHIYHSPNRQSYKLCQTLGVGRVCSQSYGEKQKLYPILFFSKKLMPINCNYAMGNHEFLPFKLALKECRHWLKGMIHSFTIFTNHKNLEYLRTAKQHNRLCSSWGFTEVSHFDLVPRMVNLSLTLILI